MKFSYLIYRTPLYSNPKLLALEFKMGFSNKNYPQSPFYPDLPLWPDNKFRVNIGLPELHYFFHKHEDS